MNTTTRIHYTNSVQIGDRVVVTSPIKNFDETVEVGTEGTIIRIGASHHTMNGGGFDITVDFGGRLFSGFDREWKQQRAKWSHLDVNSNNLNLVK